MRNFLRFWKDAELRDLENSGLMELSNYSIIELISLYGETIKELRNRGVLRTKNVVGELGYYYVIDCYSKAANLPTLNALPVGTKNVNAISTNGQRYCIKSMSGIVSGAFFGLPEKNSTSKDPVLFEYLVLCKLSDNYELEGIYELTWEQFSQHKKWNSRMKAWNITLTQAVISVSKIIYESKTESKNNNEEEIPVIEEPVLPEESTLPPAVVWEKSKGINHKQIKEDVVSIVNKKLHLNLQKQSSSRYVDKESDIALFLMSASYTEKNSEYWYSINDENIPWMELYSECYIAFALGSSDNVLLFTLNEFKSLLPGCLRTEEDEEKKKKAHYHFSFAVDNQIVNFKQKLPTRSFVNVCKHIMR